MLANDARHKRQTKSNSLELISHLGIALEACEQLIRHGRINANTFISDDKLRVAIFLGQTDVYLRVRR